LRQQRVENFCSSRREEEGRAESSDLRTQITNRSHKLHSPSHSSHKQPATPLPSHSTTHSTTPPPHHSNNEAFSPSPAHNNHIWFICLRIHLPASCGSHDRPCVQGGGGCGRKVSTVDSAVLLLCCATASAVLLALPLLYCCLCYTMLLDSRQ
jgi:hypothetical protein